MANNCYYNMKVVGTKAAVERFYKIMNYELEDAFFARIFNADIVDEYSLEDGRTVMQIIGDCAWSVYSCMMAGDYTYYDDVSRENNSISNIIIESKRLNLDIEIFSEETGVGFAEHYIIKNGEIVKNEETKFIEIYYDEEDVQDFEEWKKDLELPEDLTIDTINENDGWYVIGGFDQVFEVDPLKRVS